ncbi:CENPA protein, partial [Hypocryptadius cinnamomeus]|nr:CENPA protein [Hypocryptadius cinnamomeus]
LQEIHRYQSSTHLLLHPCSFTQLAAEAFIMQLLEDANLCSLHACQVTLFPKDLQLAWCLQGPEGG